jgi:hypothetical protein
MTKSPPRPKPTDGARPETLDLGTYARLVAENDAQSLRLCLDLERGGRRERVEVLGEFASFAMGGPA